ncbi:MAG: hypothetical protein ABI167_06455 [Nitrosospira sp.]
METSKDGTAHALYSSALFHFPSAEELLDCIDISFPSDPFCHTNFSQRVKATVMLTALIGHHGNAHGQALQIDIGVSSWSWGNPLPTWQDDGVSA